MINNNIEQAIAIGWFYFFPDGMIFEFMNNEDLKAFSNHFENKPTGHSLKRKLSETTMDLPGDRALVPV